MFRITAFCFLGGSALVACTVGCGGPRGPSKLALNPSDTAKTVLEQYDKNADGSLDSAELGACPSLTSSVGQFDKNKDGRIDADELAGRFKVWLDSPTRLLLLPCIVKFDGSPLAGAKVQLVPEEFLKDSHLRAEGITGEDGMAGITISAADAEATGMSGIKGVRLGLYRIEITHPSIKIPEKYNTATTLGIEVSPASSGSPAVFALTSR